MDSPSQPPGGPAANPDDLTTLTDEQLQHRFGEAVKQVDRLGGLAIRLSVLEATLMLLYLQIGLCHPQAARAPSAQVSREVARRLQATIAPSPLLAEIFRRGWMKVPGTPEWAAAREAAEAKQAQTKIPVV
jgi:hypothetical protein